MFSRVQHDPQSNSRKRRKISPAGDDIPEPDSVRPAMDDKSTTMPLALPAPPVTTRSSCLREEQEEGLCIHEEVMKRLEPDLEMMKHLVTCKICQHFLTEPYNLACGHTYCYICLDTWLGGQEKRTCPECRMRVWTEPVPSYVVKEMVSIFESREELLPEGDTLAEVRASAKEAADKVALDRGPQGEGALFRGIFRKQNYLRDQPYFDEEDNVYRCPYCGHEVADVVCTNAACLQSGIRYQSDEDPDYTGHSDISDGDVDRLTREEMNAFRREHYGTQSSSSDDDETDSEMEAFINDGEEDDSGSERSDSGTDEEGSSVDESSPVALVTTARRGTRSIVIESDSDDSAESTSTMRQSRRAERTSGRHAQVRAFRHGRETSVTSATTATTNSYDDSDDEIPVYSATSRQAHRKRNKAVPASASIRTRVVLDDDDDAEESSEHSSDGDDVDETGFTDTTATSRRASDDDNDDDEDGDSAGSEIFVSPMTDPAFAEGVDEDYDETSDDYGY